MGRKLQEQALTIYCRGAIDPGTSPSGVARYYVRALRAAGPGNNAPADSEENFGKSVLIGVVDNLDSIRSYRDPNDDPSNNGWKVRDYNNDGLNQYPFKWFGWEDGFEYRFWVVAEDHAGNREPYEKISVSLTTPSILENTRPPQFSARTVSTLIPYNSYRKSDSKLWTASISGLWFNIDPDDSYSFPGWDSYDLHPDTEPSYLFGFQNSSYAYIAEIQDNDAQQPTTISGLSGGDRVQVYCNGDHPILQLDQETRALTAISDINNLSWQEGQVAIFNYPTLKTATGIMSVEFTGVNSLVGDLDHYKIERYVDNVSTPIHASGQYGYDIITRTEDTTYLNFNLRWDRDQLGDWDNTSAFNDDTIYGKGLYVITPVDIYDNEGMPVLTQRYENKENFFPATGLLPKVITSSDFVINNDGTIRFKWDDPIDDDLRGFQIQRRRGIWGNASTTTGSDNPDNTDWEWDTWEIIISQEKETFDAGTTYDRTYLDTGLEPFSTETRSQKIAYQYRIRAFDYSGNTSWNQNQGWVSFSSNTLKAIDTTVDATGSNLNVLPKIGTMGLEITQPSNGEAWYVHVYRSINDNSHYSSDPAAGTPDGEPFMIAQLPATGTLFILDSYPAIDEEITLYYKLKFEDQWGNLSGFVNEAFGQSKTSLTSFDSEAPYQAEDINVEFRKPLPGDISVTDQNLKELTYNASALETLNDYFDVSDQFDVFNAYGDDLDRRFTVATFVSGLDNVIKVEETISSTFANKNLTDAVTSKATIKFTSPPEIILSGTITINNGSPIISGINTEFQTDFNKNENIKILNTSNGDVSYQINSIDSDIQITLNNAISENSASGLDYRGSQDYREASIFKRQSDSQPISQSDFSQWGFVGRTGGSTIQQYEDKSTIPGYWQYGISTADTFNNDSEIAIQEQTNGQAQSPAYIQVIDALAPKTVSDVQAVGGAGRITFSWSQSDDDVDHYTITVRDQSGTELFSENPIYAEMYTRYNVTTDRRDIAKQDWDPSPDNYWEVKITATDASGNSSETPWTPLVETSGATQNCNLDDYHAASGNNITSSALDTILGSLSSSLVEDGGNNGGDGDVILNTGGNSNNLNLSATGGFDDNIGSGAARDEIEKLILVAKVTEAETSNTYDYRVTEFTDREPTTIGTVITLPDSYHHTNILRESDDSESTIQYKFIGITWGGRRSEGSFLPAGGIYVTDTTGPDVTKPDPLGADFKAIWGFGQAVLRWKDVINKNGAGYEIFRSPNKDWSSIGTTCEKIGTVWSSRAADIEFLTFVDNDWDAFLGNIPNRETELADGSYNHTAYYRLVGVDRFGNRPLVSNDTMTQTSNDVQTIHYQTDWKINSTCTALLPLTKSIVATNGTLPELTGEAPPSVSLVTGGKFGGQALQIQTGYVEFNPALVGGTTDFIIDFYVKPNGWLPTDNADHFIMDVDSTVVDSNRFSIVKNTSNYLRFEYRDRNGLTHAVSDHVNNLNFGSGWNHITVMVDTTPAISLYVNAAYVSTLSLDLTATASSWTGNIRLGADRTGTNANILANYLSFWNTSTWEGKLLGWHRADVPFQSNDEDIIVPGILNISDTHIETETRNVLVRNFEGTT